MDALLHMDAPTTRAARVFAEDRMAARDYAEGDGGGAESRDCQHDQGFLGHYFRTRAPARLKLLPPTLVQMKRVQRYHPGQWRGDSVLDGLALLRGERAGGVRRSTCGVHFTTIKPWMRICAGENIGFPREASEPEHFPPQCERHRALHGT